MDNDSTYWISSIGSTTFCRIATTDFFAAVELNLSSMLTRSFSSATKQISFLIHTISYFLSYCKSTVLTWCVYHNNLIGNWKGFNWQILAKKNMSFHVQNIMVMAWETNIYRGSMSRTIFRSFIIFEKKLYAQITFDESHFSVFSVRFAHIYRKSSCDKIILHKFTCGERKRGCVVIGINAITSLQGEDLRAPIYVIKNMYVCQSSRGF